MKTPAGPLSGILVVELGNRLSVAACGSLLAQLGATVVFVEPGAAQCPKEPKWRQRALWAAGKRSLVVDSGRGDDLSQLRDLIAKSDVVLTSSDDATGFSEPIPEHVIGCDLSAFGTGQCEPGQAYSELELQALAGLIHTTGSPSNDPVVTRLPVIELSSGVYAAAAVIAALRVRRTQRIIQNIDVALFDCAVTMLATFLPKHFVGQSSERIGNRHPSISPWNCYRARDGWIQICTGTEDQWRRLSALLVAAGKTVDPQLNSRPERMSRLDELDSLIDSWTAPLSVAEVISEVSAAGIPCGPVHTIAELMSDPNLVHRRMVLEQIDPLSGQKLLIPGNVFAGNSAEHVEIPVHNEARGKFDAWPAASAPDVRAASITGPKPALAGVRVLEIGQWTTAPLAARLMASLGADVVKIETSDGDPARGSPPLGDGKSYLFNLNNSEKRCVAIDMRSAEGKSEFARLVSCCDVVIENLKPGSLARLGFSFVELSKLNPRVVYCAISGFGADSVYEGRAAMDTVLQAMCGVMDLTRQSGTPYKTGVSISDLLGGYFGILSTLAALERCAVDDRPQFIDLSMQDLTAWLTQMSWNSLLDESADYGILRCKDGFLLVPSAAGNDLACLSVLGKEEVIAVLREKGIRAVPVRTVSEVAEDPRIGARETIINSSVFEGRSWPLLGTPFKLQKTPAVIRNPPVDVGTTDDILRTWKL